MASPEDFSEWLSEELHVERPTPEDGSKTLEAQLRELTTQSSVLERGMGPAEVLMQVMHENGMFVLCRVLTASVSRVPEETEVRRALSELIKWNPAFRVSVSKGDKWELVGEKKEVEPRLFLESQPRAWKEVAEEQMSRPIADNSAPQFRCHYLNRVKGADGSVVKDEVAFVFILNHSLVDGISCVTLLRKFVSLLNSIVRSQPFFVVPWSRMFPPVDEYFQKAVDDLSSEEGGSERREAMTAASHMEMEGYFSLYNLYTAQCGTEADAHPDLKHVTGLVTREMDTQQVDALRSSCRKRGVTIQGAAQTAGVMVLASMLPSGGEAKATPGGEQNNQGAPEKSAESESEVSVNAAVNLRNHIASDVPADYAGYYVALLTITQTVKRDAQDQMSEFWRLAAEVNADIRGQIKRKDYLQNWLMLTNAAEKAKTLDFDAVRVEKESRTEMLFATTYGPWEFPVQSDDVIKTSGVFCASSVHRVGPVVQLQLVTVNGRLYITVAYSQRVLSRKTAEKFADQMMKILQQAHE